MKTIHILGIGNILMGDEGAGVYAVRHLQQYYDLPDVEIMDGGTGGFHLLSFLQDAEYVILVDATVDRQPPGTISKLYPKYSSDYPPTIVAHDVGLKDLLDAMHVMQKQPAMTLFTISIEQPAGVSTEAGDAILNAVPLVCEQIAETIKFIQNKKAL